MKIEMLLLEMETKKRQMSYSGKDKRKRLIREMRQLKRMAKSSIINKLSEV